MDSGLTTYRSAIDRLFARTGSTSKFGLERTLALLALLDDPQRRFASFHIAGTNGKGSVVATLDALLRAKRIRVARYTSPHLVDFRERIVVDGEEISESEVRDFIERWESDSERLGATFFEITTALALNHFASKGVDVAIIETGLGGRLDSTNVITPIVAAVTSIGIDHTEYLGNTIAEIAREKGGIFKRGVPAVIGPVTNEARAALVDAAANVGAIPVIFAEDLYAPSHARVTPTGTRFRVSHGNESTDLITGLIGTHQASNTCIALAMLDAAGDPYRSSLSEAREILTGVALTGRFQRIGKVILDVAHNPDGVRALVTSLEAVLPARPLYAVLGILSDKDWRRMMDILCPAVDCTILTLPPSVPPTRAWDPTEAFDYGRDNGWSMRLLPELETAIRAAEREAETVLITGSFHTVGDSLQFVEKH